MNISSFGSSWTVNIHVSINLKWEIKKQILPVKNFYNLKYKASTSAKNDYNILVITKHLEKYKYCISSNWCIGTSLKFSEKEGS